MENLGRFGHDHDHIAQPDYEVVKNRIKNKEGCKLEGQFYIDAVPGSFIISAKAFYPTIERLKREGLDTTNLEHKIKELYFGESLGKNNRFARFELMKGTLFNTLRNKERIKDKNPMIYQYYLKIVPAKYKYLDGKESNKYQYTANSFADFVYNSIPSLYFKYDLSPITVEYKYTKMSFLNLMLLILIFQIPTLTISRISCQMPSAHPYDKGS